MQQRGVLNNQRVGMNHGFAQPDRFLIDAAERHHRSAHPLRTEARKRLRALAFEKGCDRKQLGGGYHALAAAAVNSDLKHSD
jgi:hypothetical protein